MTLSERELALKVLNLYEPQKSNLTQLLNSILSRTDGGPEFTPGSARHLVWGVVRRLNTLDYCIDRYRKKTEKPLRNILRIGVYQLLYGGAPDYAAVNEAVKLAPKIRRRSASGLVNAVLRGLLRDKEKLFDGLKNSPALKRIAVTESHPEWMVARWMAREGEKRAAEICSANNRPVKLALRTNTCLTTRAELMELLKKEGVDCAPSGLSPDGIVLNSNPEIEKLAGYASGMFLVQDEGSQLVSYLAAPGRNEKILDLCCGSGVKTSHLAALAKDEAEITAVDTSEARLLKARENFKRLRLKPAKFLKEDAAALKNIKADKVLVDAPCSGLGTIARKPDIKWNRTPRDVEKRYPELQSAILENAGSLVKPGGVLVYCTCTTEPEENENVADAFLKNNGDFSLETIVLPGDAARLLSGDLKTFRTSVPEHCTDGFYAVKMRRKN